MSGISVVGWSVDEMLLGIGTSWLGWHAVFALFGGVAPLLALLAQPHRGPREKVTATIAVDIAGIAVLTGFLYSHFAVAADPGAAARGMSGIAVAALRASAVSRLHRHGDCRHGHARPRMETGVPAPCDRPVDFVHHADAGQRGDLAGLLSDRVAWRRDVDSAVRVLSVGGVGRAGIATSRGSRPTRRQERHRDRG